MNSTRSLRYRTVIIPQFRLDGLVGCLIAHYEHTDLVQGAVRGVDSFDQWGVKLSKVMAGQLDPVLSAHDAPDPTGQDS
jgi:glucose-6-phosphate isomerase